MATATKDRKPKTAAGRAGAKAASAGTTQIQIDRIAAETIRVPIIGTTPLLMHRFSEKAKRMMLDKTQGKKTPKEPKDPKAEYEACFYRLEDGSFGFPTMAFKDATVGAARFYGKDVTMTALRQFLPGWGGEVGSDGRALYPIIGEPEMREDVVKVGQGGTELRYRPQIREWSTILQVTYTTGSITRDSVLSLIDAGGMGCGVGDWRPEKNGDFGCYRINTDADIEVIG